MARIRTRSRFSIAATAVVPCLVFALCVVVAPQARADEYCYDDTHCYSTAQSNEYANFSYGSAVEGPDAYTAVNPTYAGQYAHFNSEGWSVLDNGDYLEAGIRNGYREDGEPYGTYYFWAEDLVVGGNLTETSHYFGSVTFNPSQENIEVFSPGWAL